MVKVISTNDVSLTELADMRTYGGEVLAARGSNGSLSGRLSGIDDTIGIVQQDLATTTKYPILGTEGNKVVNKSYPYGDIRRYGAVGDGTTDCTTFIQNAIDCNKKIYVPSGVYKITSPLFLYQNQEFYGDGETSKITNTTATGANRMVLVAGVYGDTYHSNSCKEAPYYAVTSFAKGSRDVTIATSNVSKFNVGDIVLVRSVEQGDHNPLYQQIDEVRSINSSTGVITLKYGILLDGFVSGQTNIANLTIFDNMFSAATYGINKTVYVGRNLYVHDLFLEQAVDSASSGWYVLFTSCYESLFENIKFYGSTPVGSNLSAFTKFRNCYGNYHGGTSDNCEFQYMNVMENLRYFRVGSLVNSDVGFTFNNGAFNTLRNSTLHFGGTGSSVTSVDALYTTIENCTLIDGNRSGAGSIMGCTRGTMSVKSNTIICHDNSPALSIYGTKNIVTNNNIFNCNRIPIQKDSSTYYEDNTINGNSFNYYDVMDAELGSLRIKGNHDFSGSEQFDQGCAFFTIASDTNSTIYSNSRVRFPVSGKKTLTVCLTLPVVANNFTVRINGTDTMTFSYTPTASETVELAISLVANTSNMRVFAKMSNGKVFKYATVSIGALTNRYFTFDLVGYAGVANTITRNYYVLE